MCTSDWYDEPQHRREAQDALILASLVAGFSYAEAAQEAGVSARTVRRRMSEASFAREVSRRRGERVHALAGRLLDASHGAVEVLRASLTSPDDGVRLRAAILILSAGVRIRHAAELEARLQALEDRQAARRLDEWEEPR